MNPIASFVLKLIVCVLFVTISLSAFPGVQELKYDQIKSVQLLGHNYAPSYVLSEYSRTNTPFVTELANTINEININEGLYNTDDEIKLILAGIIDQNLTGLKIPPTFKERIQHIYTPVDRWFQDFAEILSAVVPDRNLEPHHLLLDMNRGRGLAYLGGIVSEKYDLYYYRNPENAPSGNYGGNTEVTPNNIYYTGTNSTDLLRKFFLDKGYSKDSDHAFLDNSWLYVGHVDEYVAHVLSPNSECGFAIIKADPILAKNILNDYTGNTVGVFPSAYQYHDMVKSFKALKDYMTAQNPENREGAELFNTQEILSKKIDANVEILKEKIGNKTPRCKNIEVIPMPVLFTCERYNPRNPTDCYALLPGVVNLLVLRNNLLFPDPFFPPYQEYIKTEMEKLNQKVYFINDMYYHENLGEIHCGTNVIRSYHNLLE